MSHNSSTIRSYQPVILIIIGIIAASTASIFIRYAQMYVPSIVIAALRLGIATAVLLPVVAVKNTAQIKSLSRSDLFYSILAGVFLAIHFLTWTTSLEYTTVASSVVFVSTVPIWVAILSPLLISEPVSRFGLFGMMLALIGTVVIAFSDICTFHPSGVICPGISDFVRGEAFIGDMLALAGAISAALYIIFGRRVRSKVNLLSYVFVVFGIAGLILLGIVLLKGIPILGYPAAGYFWILLIALIPQLIGHTSFNWALGYFSAGFVSILLLAEPIGATILAYIIFDEVPGWLKAAGSVLIFAGIYIATRGESSSFEVDER